MRSLLTLNIQENSMTITLSGQSPPPYSTTTLNSTTTTQDKMLTLQMPTQDGTNKITDHL